MKNILLITNKIPQYRKPLYELLGKYYYLSIAHFGSLSNSKIYNEIELDVVHRYGLILNNTDIDYSKYDVIIVWASLRFNELYRHAFRKKRDYKLILIGPGVSSSYTKMYDESSLVFRITKSLIKKSDAAIFYDNYPLIRYSSRGIEPSKLFAAVNTVVVNKTNNKRIYSDSKKHFLFIGTLYKEKGIFTLLDAYLRMKNLYDSPLPKLLIVGDGPEKGKIEEWISENELTDRVELMGKIIDDKTLEPIFNKSIACISPHQAGLSVLKSFAYGVPFVTTKYPVSGGEFTAVQDNVTGFLYDGSVLGMSDTLAKIMNMESSDISIKIDNCYNVYEYFRSPGQWVTQVNNAIEYCLRR